MLRGHLPCEEKPRNQCFLSLDKRWLWERLAAPHTYEEVIEKIKPWSPLEVPGKRTRDDRHKLKKEVQTRYKEKLFHPEDSQAWSRLLRDVVQSLSLEIFKTQLDTTLSNLTWPQIWDYFEQEIGLEMSWGPFLPELP